ncbi:hypothetical protein HHI36_016976 [Cryptolaemus montrouzieri]|uniref:C2H2-type domain-containing protein n=1 Tax=Cryptolaemus montrouzieri TaxID=559131 RepID=A0ABD2NLK9_9CUCU
MQSEIHQNCPQCGNLIVGSAKRLIKDSCGHEKCRVCLLSEVDGCRRCLGNQNSKNSVDEVKTSHVDDFFARDNHATVITYNNLYDNQKDLNAEQGETEHSLCEQAKLHVDTVLNEAESTCLATTCTTFVKKKSKATLTKRNYKAISIPNHISIEGEPSLFKCNICSSKFRTKGHIKYHIYCVGGYSN